MNKYCIYCRGATTQQNVGGSSIAYQTETLKKYALDNKLNIVSIFQDIGSHDKFEEMMKMIKNGDVNCILVTDLSRIGRSPYFMNEVIKSLGDGTLESIRTATTIYRNNAESKLVLSLMFCFFAFDKEKMSESIKRGITAKKLKKQL